MKKINKRDVGERCRKAREKRGLTQSQAGKPLSLSRTPISRIELGTSETSVYQLEHLAKIYGVSLVYLLYGEDARLMGEEEVADYNLYEQIKELPAEQRKLIWDIMRTFK